MAVFEFPLRPEAQEMQITLGSTEYTIRFWWSATPDGGWAIDMSALDGTPLLRGVPLTAGQDVLGQFAYLGIPGSIYVTTDDDQLVEPTYANLGTNGKVLFVT